MPIVVRTAHLLPAALAGLLLGCDRDGGGPLALTACALDPENALRITCAVTRFPPGPVEIEVTDPVDGRTRVFSSTTTGPDHVIRLWGLHEEADIAWTASSGGRSISGVTRTGTVPEELGEPPVIEVSGDHRTEAVLVPR
ncbi:MAG: hypothetical protein H0V89_01250, partial [Deltaproteobacteria bacterium]|nr:hypothetical protein [Deltaproteobacteria bacterium]